MLSIAIPSKNEKFLNQTIMDVLKNATGEIEVFPILDGYEPEDYVVDPRVKYIRLPPTSHAKKRQGINEMVRICNGEYVMSLDAHCMVAPGFDEQLVKDHQPNWVQIPRRHRLDAENWCIQEQSDNRPPIDYEYIMYPPRFEQTGFHGFKWDARTRARAHIMVDETITMQASCWFMTKEWFNKMGFMSLDYQGWGQEAEEICFTTWTNGGKCMTNKNTWYAHLHKGKKYGRMYLLKKSETRKSYEYSYSRWAKDPKFHELIERFMPMPRWPKNWKEEL